jgi:DMSO/TMAO reductase YedYZ molybdopterin-dependent catalytic subunit
MTAGGLLAAGVPVGNLQRVLAETLDEVELIVRNRRPLDLETPVSALDGVRTPNDAFFVRSHLGEPALGLGPDRIEVGGLVETPFAITPGELARMETYRLEAVLQCSGNGRANFAPKIPGVLWDRGAVGNAEWKGVRLADLLGRAKVKDGAAHVHFLGSDVPPAPKTPAFLRSIPIAKVVDHDTILAFEMNGEPLPFLHGGPARLVVPGWTGNHWMKWVRSIVVSTEEAPGFYQQTGYKMPKTPAPPDAVLKPGDLVSLTWLNVKSLITWPLEGRMVNDGKGEVRGVAWTGDGQVTKVEVSTSLEPEWRAAEFTSPPTRYGWRTWRCEWQARRPSKVVIRARATDSRGQTQPEVTPWNKSGYLWNGVDQVTVQVS